MTATRFRVVFSHDALSEDLRHATPAQRLIGEAAAERLSRKGITSDQLLACLAEGHDGSRLPGCVKTYLPQPDGRCGMVLQLRADEQNRPFLQCVAFGERHPLRDSRRPSVYEVADRRLRHGT